MQQEYPILYVNMFGSGRILYGDKPILVCKNNMTRAVQLLMILFYSGPEGISRNRLLDSLYGQTEMSDMTNNLRVTCHRLKKMLFEAGLPEYEYISVKNKIYRWESPMETRVDALVFKQLIQKSAQTDKKKEKMELLKRACEMYTGEFMQNLSGEEWVLSESIKYRNLYTKSLQEICEYLKECREYEEILSLVTPACEMYPFDEWQSVKIDCYIGLNRYKDAVKEYDDTVRLFFEELGIHPSEKMMNQMESISGRISSRPRAINEYRNILKEEEGEEGAFYCSLPSFRDEYRLVRRIMERYGQSIYLMLCTITDGKGHPMKNSAKLEGMSARLFESVKKSLRRCDSFTKCNPAQYLVLLMETKEEDCSHISGRIAEHFCQEHRSWSQNLDFYISSVLAPENEKTKIMFQ